MIPLHCLCAKSNNRTRGQFECDVTWFVFCFDFVRSYAQCGCCSVVCLRFQVVQKNIRSTEKWVLKMWIIINKRHFLIFLVNYTQFHEEGDIIVTALKITTGQRSLTVVKVFVTAGKPCWTVNMTATAYNHFHNILTFETFWCFTKLSFHHKWKDAGLLVITMEYTSCSQVAQQLKPKISLSKNS